jgi:lipopolysaccharide export system protein LptA
MKHKTITLALILLFLLTGTVFAAKPVIKSDRSYFDINTGLYVLSGNVTIQVKNRTITAGQAKVSMASLEVWGSGGVTITQDDIFFSGDCVYAYGSEEKAKIDGGIVFRRTGLTITADQAEYDWDKKIAVFQGNVKINQNGNVTTTDKVSYHVTSNTFL